MDVRAMDFPENSFDAVIDKATFDSVVVKFELFSVVKDQILMPIKCYPKFIEFWLKMVSM